MKNKTDYTELVEALRYCAESGDFKCGKDCPMHTEYPNCLTKMDTDAAAAIEALESEIRESMQKCAECGAEPITLEQAIDRLHELGWLQEHDRILSQPHWVRCDEALPKIGQRVIVYDGWMQFMTRKDDQLFNGKMYWENEEGNWERVDYEAYWMPIEPPQEVQE